MPYIGNHTHYSPAPILRDDLPNRFLAWGRVALPWKMAILPTIEYRNGLPYSQYDVLGNYAGVPNSFRYCVTDFGFRIALFFTRTYNRLLRPGLAAALPALRAITAPLQHAFNTLAVQIDAVIKHTHLAEPNLTHLHQVSFVKQG